MHFNSYSEAMNADVEDDHPGMACFEGLASCETPWDYFLAKVYTQDPSLKPATELARKRARRWLAVGASID